MRMKPNDIDVLIGTNMRLMRIERGETQEGLAGEMQVTFQQIQKYEAGTNRVSASRLWRLSEIFEVSLYAFFRPLKPLAPEVTPSTFQESDR